MDERADRGEFYPGGRTTPEGGGGTDTGKVDRVNLGEIPASYTLNGVWSKVNQIVRAMAPAVTCLALCARAATGVLEDLPNTAQVVTNEEDAVAMAAVGALGAATSNQVAELSSAFRTGLADGTNAALRAAMGAVAAESNRVDATFAKRSEIPAAPDLAPYALKSELPQDYLTENDITNFATRAWINSQNYAREGTVYTRLDAQDLAIAAASQRVEIVDNAWRAADAAASNRVTGVENTARNNLAAATNRVWQGVRAASNELARADASLQREIDALEIVAVDGKAATRLVTPVGSLWQDATGTVWQVVTARACTNATEEWTYLVDGQTYTRAQMIERAGGDEDYSQILVWMDSNFEGADGTTRHFEGWFVRDGSGTAPVGYSFATDEIPAYAADMLLAQVDYYGGITAMRGEEVLRTNAVDRVAYTNDLAAAMNGVMGEVDNRFNQWGEMGTVLGARTLVGTSDTVTADAVIEAIGSGGGGMPEWRVEWQDSDFVHFVTNGMAMVRWWDGYETDVSYFDSWPEGAAMMVRFVAQGPITSWSVTDRIKLVGYGLWPTNNFQSVWWRSGTNVYVNILVEE